MPGGEQVREALMRWKIKVHGHPFDLADLEIATSGVNAQALKEGEDTFLYAESFEQMNTATAVHDAAKALVATVNASLRLSDPHAQPLTVGSVVDATGAVTEFISVHGAHGRSRVGAVAVVLSGDRINPAPPAESLLAKRTRLIDTDDEVRKAVKFLNAPDDTLVSLAKAYEIVKGDLGNGDHKLGGQRAAAISGVNEQDLLDFLDNAAHPTLSGDMARHAGKNTKRLAKCNIRRMSHTEATSLVRRVVLAWIDAKE
jgi:hypothetical protein